MSLVFFTIKYMRTAAATLTAVVLLLSALPAAAQSRTKRGKVAGEQAQTPERAAVAADSRNNVDRQPDWGPAGYDYAAYYYLPAPDIYYDVAAARFVCPDGENWVASSELPAQYAGLDLWNCYKVVINSDAPWQRHRNHCFAYERYRNMRRIDQPTLRSNPNPPQPKGRRKKGR